MILKNKRTNEKIELSKGQFKKQFAKEINCAYESFKNTEKYKQLWKSKSEKDFKAEFEFNIQWNFNHLANSAWYIEKL